MTFASQWSLSYAAASQWAVTGNKPAGRNMQISIPTAQIGEQQDAPFRARFYTKANVLAVEADVYQVLVRVYDSSGREVYGYEETPADVISTITTTAEWDADSTGYNLAVLIPGRGVFMAGGGDYTCEFVVEMLDEDAILIKGILKVKPAFAYSSVQTQ